MIDYSWIGYRLKLFLRDAISFSVFIFLLFKRYFIRDAGVRILVYHSINNVNIKNDKLRMTVPVELFKKQIEFLINSGYKIISLDDLTGYILGDKTVSQKSIVLTFDDGFRDNFYHVYNILKSKYIKATFFLACNYIDSGSHFPWNENCGLPASPMSWKDISIMAEGGMDIGSHALSHTKLGNACSGNGNSIYMEVEESKKMIENRIKVDVRHFAYPIGNKTSYNNFTENIIKASGYLSACLNIFGSNKIGDNIFRLKRTRVDWNDTIFKFRMKLCGAYDWVDKISS